MTSTIMYLASNCFRIYVTMRFCEHFFAPKGVSKWLRYLCFIGYFALNSTLYLAFKSNYVNLLSNIIPLVFITGLYNLKCQNKVLFTISIYIVELFTDGITYNIIHLLIRRKLYDTSMEMTLILYFVELLIEHFKGNHSFKNQSMKNLHFISIIAVILGSLIIGVITMQGYSKHIVVISITLLIINILVFSLYDNLLQSEQLWYENELLERQNDAYNNQIQIWEENKKATQILRHDMKNHIIDMEISLKNGEYDRVATYMKDLRQSLDIKDEFVKSGNVAVDSIVNYKLKEIQSLTDNVICSINIPEQIFIKRFDLNIILGNLLDNSIEALKKCDEERRFFDCKVTYNQGMIKIVIENTYNGVLNTDRGQLKTTKKDATLHGLGIDSVKNTIQKYNGVIEFSYDDESFKVETILCSKVILNSKL